MQYRKVAAGLAILLLLATGCSKGQAPPDGTEAETNHQATRSSPGSQPANPGNPQETPTPVRIDRAWYSLKVTQPTGEYLADHLPLPSLAGTVPVQPFTLNVQLTPWPDPEWFSQVEVQGVITSQPNPFLLGQGILSLDFPEGTAEQVLSVTLPNVNGEESVTYRLERRELPTMTMEIHTGTDWVPVSPAQAYQAEHPMLRFTFDQPVNKVSVNEALKSPVWPYDAKVELNWRWADDQTVLVDLKTFPPALAWSFTGVRTVSGLPLTASVPAVHIAQPAQLIAIDPINQSERVIGTVPVELTAGGVSPSGQHLLLHGDWVRVSGMDWSEGVSWLYPLNGAEPQRLERAAAGITFFPLTSDSPVTVERTTGQAHALSPDRTLIAKLYDEDFGTTEEPGWLYAHDLVIQDLEGKRVQVIRNVMKLFAPPKEYPLRPTLVWSPDGKRIATLTDEPGRGGAILVIDLESREIKRVATLPADGPPATTYDLAWNGDRFIVGRSVLDSGGNLLMTLPGSGSFSPDGKWIQVRVPVPDHHDPSWGEIGLAPLEGGDVQMLGEGMPVGWLPSGELLIIRWPDWRHRYMPLGI